MVKTQEEKTIEQKIKGWFWSIFGIVALLIVFFGCFFVVGAGERAVLLTFGDPAMQEISEGLHFKIPMIQTVEIMDIKTQKYESDNSAASKDLQTVAAKIAINYHLESASVPTIYKEIGRDYQARIMQPAEQESVKAITARFTAEELITKRESVRQEIKSLLQEKLAPRGIVVEDVLITNFDFSPQFNLAIEQKVTAEQLKLKAQMDLERIKVEAEQTVAKAQAEATSLSLQKAQITPDLIELRRIEVQKAFIDKWDSKLPLVLGGNSMIYDISGLVVGQ